MADKIPDLNFIETPQNIGQPQVIYEDDVELAGDDYIDPATQALGDYADKDKEAIFQELQATQQKLNDLQNNANQTQVLNENFEKLNENLSRPQINPQRQVQPQKPQQTEEEFREKFNSGFYDDPYTNMQQMLTQKFAPAVQQLLAGNLKISKQFLTNDNERRETYEKYSPEIEAEVQQLSQRAQGMVEADIYQRATDNVAARHISDIMEDQVTKRVNEVLKEKGLINDDAGNNNNPLPPPNYSVSPGIAPQGNASNIRKKTIIKLSDNEKLDMSLKGMRPEEYTRYLARNPQARK